MKRLVYAAIFSVLYANTGLASELILKLVAQEVSKQAIFTNYVSEMGLHKEKADCYHVTVGWVKDVAQDDSDELKKFMLKELQQQKREKQPVFVVDRAARYMVGKRTQETCAIVLYPDEQTMPAFVEINVNLERSLFRYNAENEKDYSFISDVTPQHYRAHVTLANTPHIRQFGIDRSETIEKINEKIAQMSIEFGAGIHQIVLR